MCLFFFDRFRNLYAATEAGAFVLQRNRPESCVLAADADQANGNNCCKNPGFHVQMGNDHECIQAVFSQGNEKAGKGWNHSVHGQDH